MNLHKLRVYLGDGTIRSILRYDDRRPHPPWLLHLFGEGFWSGIPVFSEAISIYDLSELKQEVLRRVSSNLPTGEAKEEFELKLLDVQTFDDLFALVPRGVVV